MASVNVNNAARAVTGEMIWSLGFSLIAPMTVLTVLLRRHGAEPWMLGVLLAVQGIGLTLPQPLGTLIFRSRRRLKPMLMLWHVAAILPPVLAMGAIAYFAHRLPDTVVRWSLLGLFACEAVCGGILMAVWMDWIAHVFSRDIRGKVVGAISAGSAAAGAASALAAGYIISRVEGDRGYALLYLLAWVMGMISIVVYNTMRDPAAHHPDRIAHMNWRRLRVRFRASLRDANFRAFLIGRLLATLGFSILPFVTAYYISEEGGSVSAAAVVSYSAVMAVCQGLTTMVIGHIGDRRGHRLGVLLGVVMQVVTLTILITTPGPLGCLLAFAGAGICGGAAAVSHYNILIETCPHGGRAAHISVGNLVLSPMTMFAPLLGGLIATQYSITAFFKASLFVSAVATLWMVLKLKEPRTIAVFEGEGP